MPNHKWLLFEPDVAAEKALIEVGIPLLAARVLSCRGRTDPRDALESLRTDQGLISDPSSMIDIDKGAARIRSAIENKELITIYGDYDVDGITAVVVLYDGLTKLGASCHYYIPDRREEGYGMKPSVIDELKAGGTNLIITVDMGITAIDEVAYASNCGIDVIITDHHIAGEQLPAATAVINPRLDASGYPDRKITGCCVAFLLLLHMYGFDKLDYLLKQYADLVAISTIADMVPLVGANRAFVALGLECMNRKMRVGLEPLFYQQHQEKRLIKASDISFLVAPKINAAGRSGRASLAVRLLMTDDTSQATYLAKKLSELNRNRKKVSTNQYETAEIEAAEALEEDPSATAILLAGSWNQGVTGILASRLSEKYKKPVFFINLEDENCKGSGRSGGKADIFKSLQNASHLLENWGGHKYAVGFTIKKENIPAFKKIITHYDYGEINEALIIDLEIKQNDLISGRVERELQILEPHGSGNTAPLLLMHNVEVLEILPIGTGKNTSLRLRCGNETVNAFYFGKYAYQLDISEHDIIDIVFYSEFEKNASRTNLRVIIEDYKQNLTIHQIRLDELDIYERFVRGEPITPEEAIRIHPTREHAVALWRHIKRGVDENGELTEGLGPMCRRISREQMIPVTYASYLVVLDALRDTGNITYTDNQGALHIKLLEGKTLALGSSETMRKISQLHENAQ